MPEVARCGLDLIHRTPSAHVTLEEEVDGASDEPGDRAEHYIFTTITFLVSIPKAAGLV